MRQPALASLLLLLAALLTSGCDLVLTTAQLPPIREDRILGQWKDLGESGSTPDPNPQIIRFADDQYLIGTADDFAKNKATPFTLARAGNLLVAQTSSNDSCDEFAGLKGRPCWFVNGVQLEGDRMSWYDLDAVRLGRESYSGGLNIEHSVHRERRADGTFDNSVLLAADAAGLERFLETYLKQPDVLKLNARLERVQ